MARYYKKKAIPRKLFEFSKVMLFINIFYNIDSVVMADLVEWAHLDAKPPLFRRGLSIFLMAASDLSALPMTLNHLWYSSILAS